MKPSAEVALEVPFHDVDSMQVVWHGHYVKYLEVARTALTRALGMDIADMAKAEVLWPVVVCQLKYIHPLRYGQRFRVRATLDEFEHRLKVAYVITDETTGKVLNRAHTVQLAVDARTGEVLLDVPRELFPNLSVQAP